MSKSLLTFVSSLGNEARNMEVTISGLKCDHCTYRDDSVPFTDYKDSIGKPCPECGNSLLTQADYEKCFNMLRMAEKINKIGKFLRWFNPMHYYRLIFNVKPKLYSMDIYYPNDKNKKNV